MVTGFDFEGVVVVEFGRAGAADSVYFVEALPGQEADPGRKSAMGDWRSARGRPIRRDRCQRT